MSLKIIKRLRILLVGTVATATHVLTLNSDGDVVQVPFTGSGGHRRNVDGGFANTAYLNTQNVEGGSAVATTNGIINGGNALNA